MTTANMTAMLQSSATTTVSPSPFTALGPDLFEIVLAHLCSKPLTSPLTTDQFRDLLPFALVSRTHYLWTLSAVRKLSILPLNFRKSQNQHHLPTLRPTRIISASDLARALLSFPSLLSLHISLAANLNDSTLLLIARSHPNLRNLGLPACRNVTTTGIIAVADHCPNLLHLDVSYCTRLGDGIADAVVRMTQLRGLNIAYLRISDSFIDRISGMYLDSLCITACVRLTDDAMVCLQRMPSLKSLSFRCAPGLTERGISQFRGRKLKRVDFGLARNLTDNGIGEIGNIDRLEGVGISQCKMVTDVGVRMLARLQELRWIDLSYCKEVGNEGLKTLATLVVLEDVNVSGCDRVSDAGIEALAGMIALKRLVIAHCAGVTGVGIEYLCNARNAPLELVDIRNCVGVSEGGVCKLKKGCVEVRTEH